MLGGFSPEALAGRIHDCDSSIVFTADAGMPGGKQVQLKANVGAALDHCTSVDAVLVVRHVGNAVTMATGRNHWLDEAKQTVSADCPYEEMNAEHPLFILYTSGSTGKPKGVLHTTGANLGDTSTLADPSIVDVLLSIGR